MEQHFLICDENNNCSKCGVNALIHSDKCIYNDIARHEGKHVVSIPEQSMGQAISHLVGKSLIEELHDHGINETELVGELPKLGDTPCAYELKDTSCLTDETLEEAGKRFWDKQIEATGTKVNHPPHYTSHPSQVECIEIVEHMSFNIGNAMKYLWRCDYKNAKLEDLKKAAWYVQREIERIEKQEAEELAEKEYAEYVDKASRPDTTIFKREYGIEDHREDAIPYSAGGIVSHAKYLEACMGESKRREREEQDKDSNNQMQGANG